MPTHPSARVQQAREALASRLRELRLDAGITARELAIRCQWSESKSSRIEHAKTPPSDADIGAWCRACEAEGQTADLIAANRHADAMYVEWRRLQCGGLRQLQESGAGLYRRTQLFRVYCSNVVPGFLQGPGYATALMSSSAAFRGTPDDVSEAVAARMERSRVVHEGGHRFAVLVEEAVLRYRIGDADTMAAQLGSLLSAIALPSVSLGVIPFNVSRSMWPLETFTIFDDLQVHTDSLTAAVTLTQPTEVALYARAFEELARLAVHGSEARALITAALGTLDD
ncbi:helix-turn-helix domain-containing protein [Streptomyces longisporoflavus]|uniref:Helix-turn-helix domain-containing protein n=1 Tax=Streptomyces longisporoflavus TaxID=28044 RepID=A0ABW7QQ99_9ACTN